MPMNKDNQAMIINYPYFKNEIEYLPYNHIQIQFHMNYGLKYEMQILKFSENNIEHLSKLEVRN